MGIALFLLGLGLAGTVIFRRSLLQRLEPELRKPARISLLVGSLLLAFFGLELGSFQADQKVLLGLEICPEHVLVSIESREAPGRLGSMELKVPVKELPYLSEVDAIDAEAAPLVVEDWQGLWVVAKQGKVGPDAILRLNFRARQIDNVDMTRKVRFSWRSQSSWIKYGSWRSFPPVKDGCDQ